MSSDTLPPDIADAVDRWIDSDADADLDALEEALGGASELDGDLEGRATALRHELGSSGRSGTPPWWPLAVLVVAALLVFGLWTSREEALLVSQDEAGAPLLEGVTRGTVTTRTVGPALALASPSAEAPLGREPFPLVIEARPGPNGVPVDTASLGVTYLRGEGIDLLPRLEGAWDGDTWTARAVRLPPGEHPLRITMSDEDLEVTVLGVVLQVTD